MKDSYPSSAPEIFLKPYNHTEHEAARYKEWEESGYFNPDNLSGEEPFSIIMPPPNANGSLHAGHALFVTLQDIMTRYARMRGKKALWLPGSDHAGFETQVVYEKELEKQGRSRFDMSRTDLHKEIYDFVMSKKSFMESQLRELGASVDWSRYTFTLDPKVIATVYGTFAQLDADGLLYRGKRIVNWCPKHQTSLSNLECERETRTDPFYYLQYGPFVIATARPETKFGDKYVVMHPDDTRYAQYTHGDTFTCEWIHGPITATVIKDESIDMALGTGVMTITPWHDAADFAIAQRHSLPYEQIIDWRGKLLPIAGEFAGMNIKEARGKIVEKLTAKNLVVKVDTAYTHEVPVCYKCSREIEPQVKAQWFVKMQPLADKAVEAVKSGATKIVSEQHEKVFYHWMQHIQDWNISRQIVWGIPIPAKLCTACDAGFVDTDNTLTACKTCGGTLEQDTDTFDTWFSSGQWPIATLSGEKGYNKENPGKDFQNFYPTSVMETGADILFFWVARMMMLGLYRTGEVPFKTVYLHGMVRDAKGQKMSKSKGNVISPLDVTKEYGTDALRMGLVVGNTPGTDLNLDVRKIGAYKKFANKLWNITRFVLEQDESREITHKTLEIKNVELTTEDKKRLDEFEVFKKDFLSDMDAYRFHLASEKIYHYVWDTFASTILEESKPLLASSDASVRASRISLISYLLSLNVQLLHPFMPFITETIWRELGYTNKEDMLIVAQIQ